MVTRAKDWADIAAKALDDRLWKNGEPRSQKLINDVTARALRAAYRRGQRDERESIVRVLVDLERTLVTQHSRTLLGDVVELVRARNEVQRLARNSSEIPNSSQPLSPAEELRAHNHREVRRLGPCCDLASRGHRDGCPGKPQAPAAFARDSVDEELDGH